MNLLRKAFEDKRPAIGLWQALANPLTAEICARAGYDWLLFDSEHSPNTVQTLLAQLQAVTPFPVEPVARPPFGDAVFIKQYLDIGFRSLLIPMVDSADQAARMVAATRFPPRGIRGVASATSRASGFGANANYLATAHEDICLIVQIESRAALTQIGAIAATPGVDALFIGPADLAGSLGHLGNPSHPEVQSAIQTALKEIAAAGKPSGIFAADADSARRYLDAGVAFVSLGTDVGVLGRGARELAKRCRGE